MNTPTAYSGISAWVEPPPAMTTSDAGDGAQHQDAGRVREPVAAEGELAREEAVLAEDRGQPRERGEGGVGGQEQEQRGEGLEEVEADGVAVHVVGDLRDDRLLALRSAGCGSSTPGR